jgi:hypothetical protein
MTSYTTRRTPIPGRNPARGSSPAVRTGARIQGMSSPSFQLADLAYTKLILHALKYPHQTVNGVLLGAHSQSVGQTVDIVDAVPLQHHWTNLSPMMEVGLGLVRSLSPLSCVNVTDRVPWEIRSLDTPRLASFKSLVTIRRRNVSATRRCPLSANAWRAK